MNDLAKAFVGGTGSIRIYQNQGVVSTETVAYGLHWDMGLLECLVNVQVLSVEHESVVEVDRKILVSVCHIWYHIWYYSRCMQQQLRHCRQKTTHSCTCCQFPILVRISLALSSVHYVTQELIWVWLVLQMEQLAGLVFLRFTTRWRHELCSGQQTSQDMRIRYFVNAKNQVS